jgi:hypothetical protein
MNRVNALTWERGVPSANNRVSNAVLLAVILTRFQPGEMGLSGLSEPFQRFSFATQGLEMATRETVETVEEL